MAGSVTKQNEEKNEIVAYNKIAEMAGLQSDIVGVLHKTVAKGTSASELMYFLLYCKSIGLNPINKEVWCYKNSGGDVIIFAGRDGFLKKAQESPIFNGIRSSEVRENDEFEIDIPANKISHKFGSADRGNITGAYAIIKFKDGRDDQIEYVPFKEYNKGWNTWKTNPSEMIRKTAECHCAKKAFGMSGLNYEGDFVVVNNIASAIPTEEQKEEIVENKEEERLVMLMSKCEDRESLSKFKNEVSTELERETYDNLWKTLK